MKELIAGEYCLAGHNKVKRIYLGDINGKYLCVQQRWEEEFNMEADFMSEMYDICIPIPEIIYEWQWMLENEVRNLAFRTESEMVFLNHWTRLEATKRERK